MDIDEEESHENTKLISRRRLYDILQECSSKIIDEKFNFLEEKLKEITKCPTNELDKLKYTLSRFKSEFKQKWVASSYKQERFLIKNEQWLNKSIKFTVWDTTQKPGRPAKEFAELTDRSKRRRTKELRDQVSAEVLTYAAQTSQRAAGNKDLSKVIKEVTATPTRATKFRKVIKSATVQKLTVVKHTPSQALAIFVERNFTKNQYEIIQSANKNIYPCYSLLKRAKKECYPKEESMRVTETCAEITLQDLLDHTSSRLCKYLEEVIEHCTTEEKQNIELISKGGCDGSQQSQFKQRFENTTDSDANIFQSSFVPFRLQVNINGQRKTLWQNPVPSSPRYCRPIRIRFVHETKDITKKEIKYVEEQARSLMKTKIETEESAAFVSHTLLPTMVDAKVCNAATDTASTMRCYICGLTSKDFNNLNRKSEENPEALRFGLSILHARIRFFETLLHLSYKLPIKKWQVRSADDKKVVKERKEALQKLFKDEMYLLVDIPKSGFGTTNDGNTSRRFFADLETASQITGLDLNLLQRLKVILETISSGHKINVEKFSAYTNETAKLYVQLYGWHPMPPSLHKILIHGPTVIRHCLLPIGQLSEEAAEARNKHFRQYRQNFSRKFSRVMCNQDVLNRLLLSSDPLLSSIRPQRHKKSKPYSEECLDLLLPAETDEFQERNEEEMDSEEKELEDDESDSE